MKNYIFLLTVFILISCGGKTETLEAVLASNDLEAIQKKREEIVTLQQTYAEQIAQLDAKISTLNVVTKIPLITTIEAVKKPFQHYLEIQGNVTTDNLMVLTPEFSGILTDVYVKEGDQVKKGQLLAKIDDGGLSQQLAQLEIKTALAKTTFERQARLWKQKIGSEMQYIQAKSNYDAQKEAINQIKKQMAKTQITAPFSGTIDDVITEKGSVVSAGITELMRIVNLSDMYIETQIPERYVKDVTVGKNVEVFIPVLNKNIHTKIRQVSSFINPTNRTFNVEIAVPNQNGSIKPNLTARLKINDYTNLEALLIPQSIISENAEGEQYVYVVKDIKNSTGTAERVIVKTGKTQGSIIEITEGIKDGAQIINEGARSVKSGQTVEIISK